MSTCGRMADVLTKAAKTFRHSDEWVRMFQLLSCLHDQKLTPGIALWMTDLFAPFIAWDVIDSSRVSAHKWFQGALASIERNCHMNDAEYCTRISPETMDALLVDFCNYACLPLDLALYTEDLHS